MADVSLRNVYKQFGKNEVIHGYKGRTKTETGKRRLKTVTP